MDISYAFITIAVVAAVLLFLLLKTYNGLIKMRNAVQSGWADIDVQLTRRHDLVPAQVFKWRRLAELGVIGIPGASELPSFVAVIE